MSVTLKPGERLLDARRRLECALQATNAAPQVALGVEHLVGQPVYLTLEEGARLLRFDVTAPGRPREAFLNYLKAHGIPTLHRGRVRLVHRRVLEAALLSG